MADIINNTVPVPINVVRDIMRWAYCPPQGGFYDGPSIEDTCEELGHSVKEWIGVETSDDWLTEQQMWEMTNSALVASVGDGGISKKYIVTTVQTIKRIYYVDVEDPTYAHDAIMCNEIEEFAQAHLSEDIVSTQLVDKWPTINNMSINAATNVFDPVHNKWSQEVRWDLKG